MINRLVLPSIAWLYRRSLIMWRQSWIVFNIIISSKQDQRHIPCQYMISAGLNVQASNPNQHLWTALWSFRRTYPPKQSKKHLFQGWTLSPSGNPIRRTERAVPRCRQANGNEKKEAKVYMHATMYFYIIQSDNINHRNIKIKQSFWRTNKGLVGPL